MRDEEKQSMTRTVGHRYNYTLSVVGTHVGTQNNDAMVENVPGVSGEFYAFTLVEMTPTTP